MNPLSKYSLIRIFRISVYNNIFIMKPCYFLGVRFLSAIALYINIAQKIKQMKYERITNTQ